MHTPAVCSLAQWGVPAGGCAIGKITLFRLDGNSKGEHFVYLSSGKVWHSSSKLPHSLNDFFLFFSLPVQLLHKLSVRAADGPQKLLKVNIL